MRVILENLNGPNDLVAFSLKMEEQNQNLEIIRILVVNIRKV